MKKTFYWVILSVWVLFCWVWYVCRIKQQCAGFSIGKTPTAATTPVIEPLAPADTLSAATPNVEKPSIPVVTTTVNIEELANRIIIHFPVNKVTKEEDRKIADYLKKMAETLKVSNQKVTITGHTDSAGDDAQNMKISERRAKNMRDILLEMGVNRAQIQVNWKGETEPRASNDTDAGRYENRRVEIDLD